MKTAEQLRIIATKVLREHQAIITAFERIESAAQSGKLYLKFGFPIMYVKSLKMDLENKGFKFIDKGNDGSGSTHTTILIDWSKNGDGLSYGE